jgi:hypothetical protein
MQNAAAAAVAVPLLLRYQHQCLLLQAGWRRCRLAG